MRRRGLCFGEWRGGGQGVGLSFGFGLLLLLLIRSLLGMHRMDLMVVAVLMTVRRGLGIGRLFLFYVSSHSRSNSYLKSSVKLSEGDIQSPKTSLTAAERPLSLSNSPSRRCSLLEIVSSCEDGLAGGVGVPVHAASPVRRYVRRWRRASRRCRVEAAVRSVWESDCDCD